MIKGNKKFCCILLMFVLVLGTTAVHAEMQEAKSKQHGVEVYSMLKCTFKLNENDRACANTKWAGLEGYKVKTKLFYKLNSWSEYKSGGETLSSKEARVVCRTGSVWTFKSEHYIHKNKTETTKSSNKLIVTFEDW